MSVYQNYREIKERIRQACARAGRSIDQVKIVAVSKKQPLERVQELLDHCSAEEIILGENYVQEFKKKNLELRGSYKKHLIGPLQSNKIKDAVKLFDLIESVQNLEVLRLVSQAAIKMGKVQEVLLQVNVSDDDAKSGFEPSQLQSLNSGELLELRGVKLLGLMAITRLYARPEDARGDFRKLRELSTNLSFLSSPLLSMGMSADFEIAVEEGANLVRVGSAIFGSRDS